MELCIKLVTRPLPGTWARIVIFITVVIVVLAAWHTSHEPATVIPVILGTGLAGAQVARALLAGATPASLPPAPSPQAG